MEKFTVHTGLVVPLDRENVDTDAIIPKQFLKSIKRTGFGPHVFDAWRFQDVGEGSLGAVVLISRGLVDQRDDADAGEAAHEHFCRLRNGQLVIRQHVGLPRL